jgi:hypothetical protein
MVSFGREDDGFDQASNYSTTSSVASSATIIPSETNSGLLYKPNYEARYINNTYDGEGTMVNGSDVSNQATRTLPNHTNVLYASNNVPRGTTAIQVNGIRYKNVGGKKPDHPSKLRPTGDFTGNKHSGTGDMINGTRIK